MACSSLKLMAQSESSRPVFAPYLSGRAAYEAMKDAVADFARTAPQDHDVMIIAYGIFVTEARFVEPHMLVFEGFDQEGHRSGIVCHFTQLLVRVVCSPKRGVARVITGFSPHAPPA
jgi:hypothetical protein